MDLVPGGDLLHPPVPPQRFERPTRFLKSAVNRRRRLVAIPVPPEGSGKGGTTLSASWRSTTNQTVGVPTLYVPRADVAEVQNELIRYETIETSGSGGRERPPEPLAAVPVSCPILGWSARAGRGTWRATRDARRDHRHRDDQREFRGGRERPAATADPRRSVGWYVGSRTGPPPTKATLTGQLRRPFHSRRRSRSRIRPGFRCPAAACG